MDGARRTCGERTDTYSAAFGCGDLNEGNHMGELDVWGKLMGVQKWGGVLWIGLMWLGIRTRCGPSLG